MSFLTLAIASAVSVAPAPSLTPGKGLLFACFFRDQVEQDQNKPQGLGLFVPEIAPSQDVPAENVSDPANLLGGDTLETVASAKGSFTFTGTAKLSLRAKGGAMYQADLKLTSGRARTGMCQGGPAGDRTNALAFFDGLNARMTRSRETDTQ